MMWKKLSFWILGLMLGLLVLMSGGWLTARAADLTSQASGVETPDEILEDGVSGTIPSGTDLQSGQTYTLNYKWSIPDNLQVNDKDTVTIVLPETASYNGAHSAPVYNSDHPQENVGRINQDETNSRKFVITFSDALSKTNVGRTGTISFSVVGTKTNDSGSGGSSTSLLEKMGWIDSSDADGTPTRVAWQLVVNPNNRNLGDVTVKDLLGPHQRFDEDNANTPTAKLADGSIFPLTYQSSGSSLTFNLKNVTQKIDIVYFTNVMTTDFSGQTAGQFSNYAELTSTSGGNATTTDPGTADGVPATDTAVKNFTWGLHADMGGSYLGSLQLTKTALGDAATVLPGAKYDLQVLSGNSWENYQTGLTTDANGKLTDPSVEPGTYRLVETAAPDGYLLGSVNLSETAVKPTSFTVSEDDGSMVHNLTQSDKPNGATLTKTNAKTKAAVPGATYRLVKGTAGGPDDTAVVKDNLVTDNKGQVTVSKLAPGTYYFEETQAPSGYQLNPEPVKVTITNEDTSVKTVNQSDQPTENSSSSNNSSSGSETPSSSTTDDTQSGTEPDTSSTKTTSASSTSTKTQHQVVANVGTSSSSSTLPYRHGAAAAGNGASQSQRSSKPATGVQRLLPKTNGQRSLIAMLIGFLILGLSVAGWRWHESRSTR